MPHPFLSLVATLQAAGRAPVSVEAQPDPRTAGRTAYRISARGVGARDAIQAEIDRLMDTTANAAGGGYANFTNPARVGADEWSSLGEVVIFQPVMEAAE